MTQSWPPDELTGEERLAAVDTTVANPARIWDYWVGGKDNFAADREAAQAVMAALPSMPALARRTRLFLTDAVRQLAADRGIRQFLDIGTGLPTADNTHEVAQRAAPESRIVYVDNDPVVLTHAQALLTSSRAGKTDYLYADLRDTGRILAGAARTLDFSQPVAVLILSVLHFVSDEEGPGEIVAGFTDRLAPGGCLVISAITSDGVDEGTAAGAADLYRAARTPAVARSGEQMAAYFAGCDLVEPGLVSLVKWRPDAGTSSRQTQVHMLAGVGRKR